MFQLPADDFAAEHVTFRTRIINYLTRGTNRSRLVDPDLVGWLQDRAAVRLRANNVRARIVLAERLVDAVTEALEGSGSSTFSMFTAASTNFANSIDSPFPDSPEQVAEWAIHQLGRRHYIGMVEAAYYGNIPSRTGYPRPWVSWHFHALVWGSGCEALHRLRDSINDEHAPLVPGHAPAHVGTYPAAQIQHRVRYILKAPMKEYRIYPLKGERVDEITGEVTVGLAGRYGQRKRPLRPGDAVRVMRLVGDTPLSDLCFAGGDGEAALKSALEVTRRSLATFNIKQLRRLERKLGSVTVSSGH